MCLQTQIMFQGQRTDVPALWGREFSDVAVAAIDAHAGDLPMAGIPIAGQTLTACDSKPMQDPT